MKKAVVTLKGGTEEASSLGVKTILSICGEHSDGSPVQGRLSSINEAKLGFEHQRMVLTTEQISRLKISQTIPEILNETQKSGVILVDLNSFGSKQISSVTKLVERLVAEQTTEGQTADNVMLLLDTSDDRPGVSPPKFVGKFGQKEITSVETTDNIAEKILAKMAA